MKLFLLDQTVVEGRVTGVVLALDYTPSSEEPRPRMADIRLLANLPVSLSQVVPGPALINADKDLFIDPDTGNPWRQRDDGALQFLVYSVANTHALASGRLLTLTFVLDSVQPVSFGLVRRNQTFAPPEADNALQATTYDMPVMVMP